MENLDWSKLPFAYHKTDYNIRCYYRNGKWGELEVSSSETINIHMAATCLHYGQEAFEGLKAFSGKDGKIRIFRVEENAKRMLSTAKGIMMAEVPIEMFITAIEKVVQLNKRSVPPYQSGASLYIRPLLIGTGAEVGVKPAKEYLFVVFVTPVGPYFKDGFKPVDLQICYNYDRAAPLGTGSLKVGGNYAASLIPTQLAHEKGYAAVLYLDPKEKKYIDECGPANFFGIKGNKYITPDSKSILPSITNKSLITLAKEAGMEVEVRKILFEELAEFDEVGACGTAAVITPVKKIVDDINNKTFEYCKDGNPGPVSTRLYKRLSSIQRGETEDKFGWIDVME